MNIIVKIFQIAELVATVYPKSLELAMKIKHLFELDPDFKVSVEKLTTEALTADDATSKAIAAWKKKVGVF